jgi:steroid delta-isomerase-like uncharacterized protein
LGASLASPLLNAKSVGRLDLQQSLSPFFSCNQNKEKFTMTTEQNKALMRRFLEATVASDQVAFKEFLASDFVAHLPGGPQNREAFLQHNNVFVVAFSDRHFAVEDLIAEGDKVTARTIWRGIHSGDFQGLPPTGKQVAISAIIIERIQDGKMVEHWSLFDQLSMMQQLGLVPPPQATR